MLFFTKTADLFGCKLQLLSGMAFLSVTSLTTAFAPNPIAMNVLCGFLGLGTAVVSPPAIGTCSLRTQKAGDGIRLRVLSALEILLVLYWEAYRRELPPNTTPGELRSSSSQFSLHS
jgi:hypothetical protein